MKEEVPARLVGGLISPSGDSRHILSAPWALAVWLCRIALKSTASSLPITSNSQVAVIIDGAVRQHRDLWSALPRLQSTVVGHAPHGYLRPRFATFFIGKQIKDLRRPTPRSLHRRDIDYFKIRPIYLISLHKRVLYHSAALC
jgi:hypothetical protein